MKDEEIKALAARFTAGVDGMNAAHPPAVDLSSVYDASDDEHFTSRDVAERRFYNWYGAYGALMKPKAILEIGVRRGYGALALIKGAGGSVTSYLGIDSERDLPGQNERSRQLIQAQTGVQAEILKADTTQAFPQLLPPYDLVHVDGDHSLLGAASDVLNVAPLVRPGGVIIVDDIDNEAVLQGLEIALSAIGPRVIRRDAGDVRKQALLFVRRPIPKLDFAIAAMLWRPDGAAGSSQLSFYRGFLRSLRERDAHLDPAMIDQLFGLVVQDYARRLGVAPPERAAGTSLFDAFAGLVGKLPDADALFDEARPHVAYAVERLAGVTVPATLGSPVPGPHAFERGSQAYGIMACEIAVNLSDIIERRAQRAQAAAA